jgi:hypothetical protein
MRKIAGGSFRAVSPSCYAATHGIWQDVVASPLLRFSRLLKNGGVRCLIFGFCFG